MPNSEGWTGQWPVEYVFTQEKLSSDRVSAVFCSFEDRQSCLRKAGRLYGGLNIYAVGSTPRSVFFFHGNLSGRGDKTES